MDKLSKKEKRKIEIMLTALELFSKNGFYTTTIPDIAKKMDMSVGNLYNYFSSKEELAQEIIRYVSALLGEKIHLINNTQVSTREKILEIVKIYFNLCVEQPQLIEYFLRVYLANREVFTDGCEGMICVAPFVTEIMIFFEEGVRKGDLRNQDFFSAFGLFMGYLGGMAFLNGEKMLPRAIESYVEEIAENIYRALKSDAA
ncbi:TetR/AcrR family transcriptional regulator [Hydrogenimonas cancrithermarum]|uniref:TetR family transcriptional regulator n=1 Tax=Hydrogenimonas cancrithermarum TaxID=2993563 RepID=A0ABN6WTT8_9BACT|nr:TetR/AcrR family transcriptional regulator [Hydrogenimonas cancrithermarum]BDY12501.1 TetR family transcriptional regulator [Hydrogenimonas cancrithermarum]